MDGSRGTGSDTRVTPGRGVRSAKKTAQRGATQQRRLPPRISLGLARHATRRQPHSAQRRAVRPAAHQVRVNLPRKGARSTALHLISPWRQRAVDCSLTRKREASERPHLHRRRQGLLPPPLRAAAGHPSVRLFIRTYGQRWLKQRRPRAEAMPAPAVSRSPPRCSARGAQTERCGPRRDGRTVMPPAVARSALSRRDVLVPHRGLDRVGNGVSQAARAEVRTLCGVAL